MGGHFLTTYNTYLIGVDDTDYGDSIGTGAFARELMVHLQTHLDVRPKGITRHQLLVHPDIPYTSHNSAACLALDTFYSIEKIAERCRRFVQFLFHPGADPGLCIAPPEHFTAEMVAFGQLAQTEVVSKKAALQLATAANILLEEHGGEGIGVIGALCACALRADGNDGRFIAHNAIREVEDILSVAALKATTAVERVLDENNNELDDSVVVNTQNWLRPDLLDGKVTLRVQSAQDADRDSADYFVFKKKKGTDDM